MPEKTSNHFFKGKMSIYQENPCWTLSQVVLGCLNLNSNHVKWYNYSGRQFGSFFKSQTDTYLPCDPAIPFLRVYAREQKAYGGLNTDIHSSSICNSQNLETTLVPINRQWMTGGWSQQWNITRQWKRTDDMCNDMNEFKNSYAGWKSQIKRVSTVWF